MIWNKESINPDNAIVEAYKSNRLRYLNSMLYRMLFLMPKEFAENSLQARKFVHSIMMIGGIKNIVDDDFLKMNGNIINFLVHMKGNGSQESMIELKCLI